MEDICNTKDGSNFLKKIAIVSNNKKDAPNQNINDQLPNSSRPLPDNNRVFNPRDDNGELIPVEINRALFDQLPSTSRLLPDDYTVSNPSDENGELFPTEVNRAVSNEDNEELIVNEELKLSDNEINPVTYTTSEEEYIDALYFYYQPTRWAERRKLRRKRRN